MQIQLYTITCTTYLWTCSHAGETRPSYNYKSYKDHFTHADYLGGRGWLDDSEFACNNRYLDAIPNSEAYCSDQYVSKTFEAPVSVVFLGLNEHQFWHTSLFSSNPFPNWSSFPIYGPKIPWRNPGTGCNHIKVATEQFFWGNVREGKATRKRLTASAY